MSLPLREAREIFEREYLLAQINRFGGNISRTAEFVGMERSALRRKLRALGVNSEHRPSLAAGRSQDSGARVLLIALGSRHAAGPSALVGLRRLYANESHHLRCGAGWLRHR